MPANKCRKNDGNDTSRTKHTIWQPSRTIDPGKDHQWMLTHPGKGCRGRGQLPGPNRPPLVSSLLAGGKHHLKDTTWLLSPPPWQPAESHSQTCLPPVPGTCQAGSQPQALAVPPPWNSLSIPPPPTETEPTLQGTSSGKRSLGSQPTTARCLSPHVWGWMPESFNQTQTWEGILVWGGMVRSNY